MQSRTGSGGARWLLLLACVACSGSLPCPSNAEPMFTGLGFLPGSDERSQSWAWSVSADGSTVVGWNQLTETSGYEAFRWTWSEGMRGLGKLPSEDPWSAAYGTSANGEVVVGMSRGASGYFQAYRWTAVDGMVVIGNFSGDACSADGSVVVGTYFDGELGESGGEVYRWTASEGQVGLGAVDGGRYSEGFDVSADGSVVVGGANSPSGHEGFRWTADEGMVGLGALDHVHLSQAFGVSADGSVVVGQVSNEELIREAFRWTAEDGMVGLGALPGGDRSTARAVSADGSIVVGGSRGGGAFIWDAAHGMRPLTQVLTDLGLDMSDWYLFRATGVSADGRTIVGYGAGSDGRLQGWIAYLPEPRAPESALLLALACLAIRRRAPSGCGSARS